MFPTKDELMAMPLNKLKLVDINNHEQEALVQAIINLKTIDIPPQTTVYNLDVPDIKTAEDEAKWQKIMDDRRAGLKPQVEVKSDASGIEIKVEQAEVKPVVNSELVKCDICGKEMKPKGLPLHKGKYHKK